MWRPAVELRKLSKSSDPEVAAWMKDQNDRGAVFNEPLLIGQEATLLPTQAAKKKAN